MEKTIVASLGTGRIGRALGTIIGSQPSVTVRFWDKQPGLVPDQRSFAETVSGAAVILLAVPAKALPALVDQVSSLPRSVIIATIAKGIPLADYLSPAEYLRDVCPHQPLVVIGGPMMAEEMSSKNPGHAVVASTDETARTTVARLLTHPSVGVVESNAPVSVSRAGVLKNIYGCISGMFDGFDLTAGDQRTARQRLVEEFRIVAAALNITPEVLKGPAGLGDLAITMDSVNSRNRKSGETFVRSGHRDGVAEAIHGLPIVAAAVRPKVEAPILQLAAKIVHHDRQPTALLEAIPGIKRTAGKKYGTLETAMATETTLPPEHAALLKEYESAGFHHVHIRHDEAKAIYPPHYHPDHVIFHVLEGELDVDIDGRHTIVGPGEKFDVAAERFHTTCVGPNGCVYLHAEKHVTTS